MTTAVKTSLKFFPCLEKLPLIWLHLKLTISYDRMVLMLLEDAFTLLDRGTQYNCVVSSLQPDFEIPLKVEEDRAEVLMVTSHWPTQSRFLKLTRLVVQGSMLLPFRPKLVKMPFDPGKEHPLKKKLTLITCAISGKISTVKAFQRGLQGSYSSLGRTISSTELMHRGGPDLAVHGILISSISNQLYQKS